MHLMKMRAVIITSRYCGGKIFRKSNHVFMKCLSTCMCTRLDLRGEARGCAGWGNLMSILAVNTTALAVTGGCI